MSHEDIKAVSEAYRSIYASTTEYVEEERKEQDRFVQVSKQDVRKAKKIASDMFSGEYEEEEPSGLVKTHAFIFDDENVADDFKKELKKARIKSMSVDEETAKEEQIDEARAMSAKDFGKKIDSIEDVHQEIKMSLIDSIEDVSKRKRAESALQKAYDQYFKSLSEIERMIK